MSDSTWTGLHEKYAGEDWINRPSLFANQTVPYIKPSAKILELGAGQGQDSRFFAEAGFNALSTDLPSVIELAKAKHQEQLDGQLVYLAVDLREDLPFPAAEFDAVYAHLSIHYFDLENTQRLILEVQRVLRPGGIFAFLVNSRDDPEYQVAQEIEPGLLMVDGTMKRYFSTDSTRKFMEYFDTILLDNLGETYKDRAKGVSHLIRYIGRSPLEPRLSASKQEAQ